ncbi:unnamed protein product [Albugo candida]|uniref:Complex 1 LYR protein domain-containing protein n=1 Tax=Albugo candida TaxID=65357 RepID=A0A024GHE8_9STRA|nr:unnamed protein product [Albugo candida]|eukprot:CCI46318.1 unnamed protein product [Albugo candida]
MMNRPHSGLQKQVLQLYKLLLKAAKRKDQGAENQGGTTYRYVRERFRENVRMYLSQKLGLSAGVLPYLRRKALTDRILPKLSIYCGKETVI